jgi:hypothetical protein
VTDLKFPKEYLDALAFECAKEHPLRIVVADNQVEWFRKAYGDAAIIIPLSETYLPVTSKGDQ